MNLRRPVGFRVLAVVAAAMLVGFVAYLLIPDFTLRAPVSGWIFAGVISLIVPLMVHSLLRYALQRFEVDADRDGWKVRVRDAAGEIDGLIPQSQLGGPTEPAGAENARLWVALTKAGRILAWAVVLSSMLLAGGWMLESTRYLGEAVLFICLPLVVWWAMYALYRIYELLDAAWEAALIRFSITD